MLERRIPTKEEVHAYLRDRRNWGRWGDKGNAGAINLITPEKRLQAVSLVKKGRTVSISRPFPVTPSIENSRPAHHYMYRTERPHNSGVAMDYVGVFYHGQATTHIDALCHIWDANGMWDGRDPDQTIGFTGSKYGTVDAWKDGIITRGVLLDVPRHRGKPYVTQEEPVMGWELEDIAREQGVNIQPGDAVLVYSGRDAYARDHDGIWGGLPSRPGLHSTCMFFLREYDAAMLVWDMMDVQPNDYELGWSVHPVIFAFGVSLVDNALLEPLAQACAEEGRYEFMFSVNPLYVVGGTGSPVNPIAVL